MQGITNIDDSGLAAAADLKALRQLDLAYCWRVSDEGVRALLGLPMLCHLDLAYCWQVNAPSPGNINAAAKPEQKHSISVSTFVVVLVF